MQNVVDEVVLRQERIIVERKRLQSEFDLHESEDEDVNEEFYSKLEDVIKSIPLRSVPQQGQDKRELIPVEANNEQGFPCGKFGWCINCRNEANLYCKDTRYPVCGLECKQQLVNMLDSIDNKRSHFMPRLFDNVEVKRHISDAIILFKSIC